MKQLDLHSVLFVLEWMKDHHEIWLIPRNGIMDSWFKDSLENREITTCDLLDRIKNDYEQRNKQQGG